MRFYHTPRPKEGDVRTRKLFALWPIRIGNETRWMEVVVVEDRYDEGDPPWSFDSWIPSRFIDHLDHVAPTVAPADGEGTHGADPDNTK